ncbi:glucose-1-phosphate thymidylyltransferase RfbA [Nocardia sp. NPDC046473]|uniref:glucose-1-phosphate thymidylyltransferase RfbA n=1 Tax=Nocardia sp. NPDC046473 TaxID=3155733 RepID=UPI0033DFC965
MRGIILAGGTGSRLHPITLGASKQLLPVYDKPMVYYPLATLIAAGLTEILVITAEDDVAQFRRLLGDGSDFGIQLSYATQSVPNGIAQAFVIGAEFIGDQSVALILGDNLFYGPDLDTQLSSDVSVDGGAVFAYHVSNPSAYGVIEFDEQGNGISIQEKPSTPKSPYAIPGFYFYSNDVLDIAARLRPSRRGEYEISDINQTYLRQGRLKVDVLPRGTAWLDTGTCESLMQASEFVRTIETRQGIKVGCPEEAAWRAGLLSDEDLLSSAKRFEKSGYGRYLSQLVDG